MSKLNLYGFNQKSFLDKFLEKAKGNPKTRNRRINELWILTCYIDHDLATLVKLIEVISNNFKLRNVYLYFNYAEALRYGPRKMKDMLDKIGNKLKKRKIDLIWFPVRISNRLCHSKGYAIVQKDSYGDYIGTLFVASANLTRRGFLWNTDSNIELSHYSYCKSDIQEFGNILEEFSEEENYDNLEEYVYRDDENLFRYALLTSGVFLNKWPGSLNADLSLRFSLNEIGQKELIATDPRLIADDFSFETNSLSKNYFKSHMKNMPKRIHRDFCKNFGIFSNLGYWIPISVWDKVEDMNAAGEEKYIIWFEKLTNPEKTEEARKLAKTDMIKYKKYIDYDENKIDSWLERVDSLRGNTEKLKRYYYQYSKILMPYDFSNKKEVNDLFENIEKTLEMKNRLYVTGKKVRDAISSKNLDLIHKLTKEEIAILKRMSLY